MDRVIPGLFNELLDIFKKTLKVLKENLKDINHEIWIDNSWNWNYFEYREKQNKVSRYYYLLEYLVSKFKTDFISIKKLSEKYSKNYYSQVWRKTKIRITNVFYYFHQKAIKQLRRKAHESYVKELSKRISKLDLPLVTFPDALEYDLSINYCVKKIQDLFKPSYRSRETDIGLEPIWSIRDKEIIDDNEIISAFYFNKKTAPPFLLITNLDDSCLSRSIKESGSELLFNMWLLNPEVRSDLIHYYFFPIYFKYLRKKDLTPQDIKNSKRKISEAYSFLKEYYGIEETLTDLILRFRIDQEKKIETDTPFPIRDIDTPYDPDDDISGHSYYILNSIFPLFDFCRSRKYRVKKGKKETEKDPEEIAIIDLETTGDNPYYDSIVEIGICKLNLRTGVIEPLLNQICQEKDKKIRSDAWIFKNSDLNYYDVYNAPDLKEFRKMIHQILYKYPITSYPKTFDLNFLKQRGFKIVKEFWDPMRKSQYILKIPRYDGTYKWPSFQEAWTYFFSRKMSKIKHRALDDALQEAQLVYEIYKREKEVKEPNGIIG